MASSYFSKPISTSPTCSTKTPLHLASMAGHEKAAKILTQAECYGDVLDVHDMKACDYLHEFNQKCGKNLDKDRELKWPKRKVYFSVPDHGILQDIKEDDANENQIQNAAVSIKTNPQCETENTFRNYAEHFSHDEPNVSELPKYEMRNEKMLMKNETHSNSGS